MDWLDDRLASGRARARGGIEISRNGRGSAGTHGAAVRLLASVRRTLAASEIARYVAVGLGGVLVGVAAYARFIEPSWLEVRRLSIDVPSLPPALDGLVIAQLSDLHLDRSALGDGLVLRAIRACNAARPDVVVLTGDYLAVREAADVLEQVLARLDIRPVYAVFGNHDYRYGPRHRRALERCFAGLGIDLLDNRAVAFRRNGATLWFVGVGDGYTSHDRLVEALRLIPPGERPRILLTHYPDLLLDLSEGEFDLALAGHSHGAQIHLPVLSNIALARSATRFASGLFVVRGIPLYVNRGLGTSGQRVRLLARPELTLLSLRHPRREGACRGSKEQR